MNKNDKKIMSLTENSFLTKSEVQAILKISRHTLHNLMKSGMLSYFKLERKLLFHQDDVRAFLESRRVGVSPGKKKEPEDT